MRLLLLRRQDVLEHVLFYRIDQRFNPRERHNLRPRVLSEGRPCVIVAYIDPGGVWNWGREGGGDEMIGEVGEQDEQPASVRVPRERVEDCARSSIRSGAGQAGGSK